MPIQTGQDILAAEVRALKLIYVEAWIVDSPANSASWQDIDLSSDVPAGTVAVEVVITGPTGIMGARKNGSADDRRFTKLTNDQLFMITELDTNRIYEGHNNNNTFVYFTVIGYFIYGT